MLVFFRTRKGAEAASRTLRSRLSDATIRFYHAGLTRDERAGVEKWFLGGTDGVLFATCAYGMGVDKPDIRTVVHAGVPGSVEAYLQETGRAGRDGKPARAVLLVSREDRVFHSALPEGLEKQRCQGMLGYALSNGTCRRQVLLELIGAEPVACSGCDICDGTGTAAAEGQREILDAVRRSPRRFTVQRAAEVLSGAQGPRPIRGFHDCIPGYGALGKWEKEDVEAAIDQLVAQGLLATVRRGPGKRTLTGVKPAHRPPGDRAERS